MAQPTRRLHRLSGFIVTLISLLVFFALVWPPGALLVSAAAGVLYSMSQPTD